MLSATTAMSTTGNSMKDGPPRLTPARSNIVVGIRMLRKTSPMKDATTMMMTFDADVDDVRRAFTCFAKALTAFASTGSVRARASKVTGCGGDMLTRLR